MLVQPPRIRRIRADEGPALRALRLEAIADTPTAFGSTLAETEARPVDYWQARAQSAADGHDNVLFVAEENGSWIGLAGGYLDDERSDGSVDLISMWVHPAYRGRGLGRQLVQRVVGWARERGAPRVFLWVTEGNEAAEVLYERCGFRDTGGRQALPSHAGMREREMELLLTEAAPGMPPT